MTPTAALLPDGRLHLVHGTLDVVASADGSPGAVEAAFKAAAGRFASLVPELSLELAALRRPGACEGEFTGLAAVRMARAVAAHGATFAPACVVGGAVADEILDAMTAAAPLAHAFVNNGGAVAVHLARGQAAHCRVAGGAAGDTVRLAASDGVGGLAGTGDRPHALGLADAVTVLAASATEADTAALVLAAAVDLPGHPAVERIAAEALDPDLPLGPGATVVLGCGPLEEAEKAAAVARAVRVARTMLGADLIRGATIALRGHTRTLGWGDLVHRGEAPRRRRGRP